MNYVFDLFGTLIDAKTDCESTMFWNKAQEIFRRFSVNLEPNTLKRLYTDGIKSRIINETDEPDFADVFADIFIYSKTPYNPNIISSLAWEFRKESFLYARLFNKEEETLCNLKKTGASMYILSNAQEIFTIPLIKKLGLDAYFDGILLSSQCGVKKPDSRLFYHFLDMYELDANECIYIGNNWDTDIIGADSAGMKTVFFALSNENKHPPIPLKTIVGVDYAELYSFLLTYNNYSR